MSQVRRCRHTEYRWDFPNPSCSQLDGSSKIRQSTPMTFLPVCFMQAASVALFKGTFCSMESSHIVLGFWRVQECMMCLFAEIGPNQRNCDRPNENLTGFFFFSKIYFVYYCSPMTIVGILAFLRLVLCLVGKSKIMNLSANSVHWQMTLVVNCCLPLWIADDNIFKNADAQTPTRLLN